MFGWEFPPRVSGGLGTACEGMTRALVQMGHEIVFVLPGSERLETASHVRLVPSGTVDLPPDAPPADPALSIRAIDSPLRPYLNDTQYETLMQGGAFPRNSYLATPGGYGATLLAEVVRYGQAGGEIASRETFDAIHGHDWMSIPQGWRPDSGVAGPLSSISTPWRWTGAGSRATGRFSTWNVRGWRKPTL